MTKLFLRWAMVGFLAGCVTYTAFADTVVPNPFPGFPYLEQSCGGQQFTEEGSYTDDLGLVREISVKTTCSTGGRGTRPRVFKACWLVTVDDAGNVLNNEFVAKGDYKLGTLPFVCPW